MSLKLVHNVETGEVSEVELTKDELAQRELDIKASKVAAIEADAKAQAKQAVLDKLGLTQDEISALLA
jgi:hypothetical protein